MLQVHLPPAHKLESQSVSRYQNLKTYVHLRMMLLQHMERRTIVELQVGWTVIALPSIHIICLATRTFFLPDFDLSHHTDYYALMMSKSVRISDTTSAPPKPYDNCYNDTLFNRVKTLFQIPIFKHIAS